MARTFAGPVLVLVAALGSAALGGVVASTTKTDRYAHIVILHTNDMHGQALPFGKGPGARGGFAALAHTIARERVAARAAGWDTVLVDAGDLWVGPPEGTRTEGAFVVSLLASFDYALGAIGNHEFDHGPAVTERNARASSFPILGANVRDKALARRPDWLGEDVHRRVAGVDVRFIGLLTSHLHEVTTDDATKVFSVEDEDTTVARELGTGTPGEVTVLVTHCGHEVDRSLAEHFHGQIAAIVGGHSHREIDPAWHVPAGAPDAVLVGQTGAKTRNLGWMHLVYDRVERRVVRSEGRLVPVLPAEGEDPRVEALVAAEVAEVDKALGVRLCELTSALEVTGAPRSSPLGNLICDVMRTATGADVAFTNKHGLRANLRAGPLLLRDLYEVDPFGNTTVTMTFTGAQLHDLLDAMCESASGVLEVSGLVVRFDATKPAGQRLERVLVGGEPLALDREYRVATNSFLAGGGDGHKLFLQGRDRRDTGVAVRDHVRKFLENRGRFDPGPLDERLVAVQGHAAPDRVK